jgi:putative membrane protein
MHTVENRFIAVIILIYSVGILGFMIPALNPLFLKLTPFNIIGSFIVALIFHKKWEFTPILTLLAIGFMGFFVELLGVKTGLIFGSYHYGATFGPKWQGTPYLIGLNWMALIFYTSSFLGPRIKNVILRSLAGGAMMTAYDFFLEPVAMRFDFWTWKNGVIPIQNFIAWFVIASSFHLLLNMISKPSGNRMASALFFIQWAFFIALYGLIRWF